MKWTKKILMLMLSMAILISLMASVTVSAEGTVTIPVVTAVNTIIDGAKTPEEIELTDKFNVFATNGSAPGNSAGLNGAMMNEYTDEGYLQINGVLTGSSTAQTMALQNFTLTVGNRYVLAVELKAKGDDTKVQLYNSCDLWSDAGKTVKIPKSYEYMTLKKGEDRCSTWDDDSAGILTDFVFHGTFTETNMTVSSTQTKKSFLIFQEIEPAENKGYIIKSVDLKEYVIENVEVSAIEAAAENTALSVGNTTKISVTANDEYDVTDSEYVSFESSNESVVKVDENGNVTAIGGGKAVITATLSDGTNSVSGTVEISVAGLASEITLPVATQSTVIVDRDNTMQENDSKNLKKAYLGSNIVQDDLYVDGGVALYVPPTAINSGSGAAVTSPGLIFKHSYKSGYTYRVTAKVKSYDETTEVKVTSSKTIDINNSGNVSDCAYYNDYFNGITKSEWIDIASEVTYYGWNDSGEYNSNKVSDLLNIKEARRNANYTDASNKGFYIKNVCHIESKMEDMTVSNLSVSGETVKVGEAAQLTAKATKKDTSTEYDVTENSCISYVSNNAAVAEVDANGKITAKAAGTATVTVRLGKPGEGYLETTTLITVEDEQPSVSITDYKAEYNKAYTINNVAYTAPYSIIVYGKVTGDVEKYGFTLTSEANGITDENLEVADKTADGVFAVRVVAENIETGSFTFVPYYVYGGDTETGTGITENLTKQS